MGRLIFRKLLTGWWLALIPIYMTAQSEIPVRTMIQTGHNAPITDYDISPNGRYIVSIDKEIKVCIWDIATGKQIQEMYSFYNGSTTKDVSFHKRRSDWIVLQGEDLGNIVELVSKRRIGIVKDKDIANKIHKNKDVEIRHDGNELLVYDQINHLLLSRMNSLSCKFSDLKVISNGKRIIVNGTDQLVCWNLEQVKVDYAIPLEGNTMNLAVSPDETYFLTAENQKILFRSISDGKVIQQVHYKSPELVINSASFDEEHNILFATNKGIFYLKLGNRHLKQIDTNVEGYENSEFDKVFYDSYRHEFILCTPNSWHLLGLGKKLVFPLRKGFFADCAVLDMKIRKDAILCCGSHRVCKHFVRSEEKKNIQSFHAPAILGQFRNKSCCFVNGDTVATGNSFGDIQFFSLSTKQMIERNREHKNEVLGMDSSPDGRFFYSSSSDGTLCAWDTKTLKLVAKLAYFRENDNYVIVTADNFFTASKRAFNGIHFQKGLEVFSFEQFDVQYNRPDIVAKRLGYASREETELLKKIYQRRVKRMGFDEKMLNSEFQIPETTIKNSRDAIYQLKDNKLALDLEMVDKKYPLDRIIVQVNGVPVFGRKGISLRSANALKVSRQITLELVGGENQVDVSCMNIKGAESYKKTLRINNTQKQPVPDMYILSIGVSNYQQSAYNLNYAHKDAADIAQVLQRVNADNYAHVFTKVITDDQVTLENISSLHHWLQKAKISDTFVLFYAGHGVIDENYEQFLGSYDMDFSHPAKRGIPYWMFDDLLADVPSLNKLMLIDACHSGYLDKDWIQQQTVAAKVASLVKFREVGRKIGARELEYKTISRVYDEYFSDVQKESGATIIASASGLEVALEGDIWTNGLFTSTLIEALQQKKADVNEDGRIHVSEMQQYVSKQVSKLSQGVQRPNSRTENKYQDFIIAY